MGYNLATQLIHCRLVDNRSNGGGLKAVNLKMKNRAVTLKYVFLTLKNMVLALTYIVLKLDLPLNT